MDSQWSQDMFDERLKKMVEDIKDGGGSDCGCGLRAIKGRYNDFAFSLRRHKMNKGHSCGGCVMGQGALEDGLHVLGRSAQTTGRDFVLREYSALAGLCATFCQHGINKVLKERTAMFKMGGEYIHPQWRLGCYWEQLYGFHPYVGGEVQSPDVLKSTGFILPQTYSPISGDSLIQFRDRLNDLEINRLIIPKLGRNLDRLDWYQVRGLLFETFDSKMTITVCDPEHGEVQSPDVLKSTGFILPQTYSPISGDSLIQFRDRLNDLEINRLIIPKLGRNLDRLDWYQVRGLLFETFDSKMTITVCDPEHGEVQSLDVLKSTGFILPQTYSPISGDSLIQFRDRLNDLEINRLIIPKLGRNLDRLDWYQVRGLLFETFDSKMTITVCDPEHGEVQSPDVLKSTGFILPQTYSPISGDSLIQFRDRLNDLEINRLIIPKLGRNLDRLDWYQVRGLLFETFDSKMTITVCDPEHGEVQSPDVLKSTGFILPQTYSPISGDSLIQFRDRLNDLEINRLIIPKLGRNLDRLDWYQVRGLLFETFDSKMTITVCDPEHGEVQSPDVLKSTGFILPQTYSPISGDSLIQFRDRLNDLEINRLIIPKLGRNLDRLDWYQVRGLLFETFDSKMTITVCDPEHGEVQSLDVLKSTGFILPQTYSPISGDSLIQFRDRLNDLEINRLIIPKLGRNLDRLDWYQVRGLLFETFDSKMTITVCDPEHFVVIPHKLAPLSEVNEYFFATIYNSRPIAAKVLLKYYPSIWVVPVQTKRL
ncbi:hypothetical protein ACI65C_005022 [Semiaphis heraclei]